MEPATENVPAPELHTTPHDQVDASPRGPRLAEPDAEQSPEQRVQACAAEIGAVLKKHRCDIVGDVQHRAEPVGNRGEVQIRVAAAPRVIPL